MDKLQERYKDRASHEESLELVLEDPLVRFAIENYGAQIIAVYPHREKTDVHIGDNSVPRKVPRSQNGHE
jgi:hypothetical protein